MCGISFTYSHIKRAILPLIIILGFFSSPSILAQSRSEKGWIEVEYTISCAPTSIEVRHTGVRPGPLFYSLDGDPNDIQNNQYENNAIEENSSVIIEYLSPGTYTLVVIDQPVAGQPQSDFIEFTVLPPDPPQANYSNCSGRTIQVIIDKANDPFDYYTINWGEGFLLQYSGDDPIEHTYANQGVYQVYVEGKLTNGNSSSCQTLTFQVSTFESLPVPSLTEITVLSETEIEIVYDNLTTGLDYTLQIDQGSGFVDYSSIDPAANRSSIILNDASFNSLTEHYGFKLIVEDACGSQSEESQEAYSIAFALGQESVTNQFEMDINWLTSATNFSTITLLKDDTNFITYNSPSGNESLTFPNCEELGQLSMQTTSNGVVSTSIVKTPFENTSIVLGAPASPDVELTGAVVEVSFPSTNFPLGEYVLYRKDITDSFNEVFSSTSSSLTDTTIPPGTAEVCYRLAYRDPCGNISELSEEVCLVLSSSLGIPNAFSPNGDGINDIFKINDGIYANFSILIYNRWGILVFNTEDPSQGWDGQFEGQPATSGTYLYRISFQNADNLLITKTGSFVLIR